jgi:hypothetical protein
MSSARVDVVHDCSSAASSAQLRDDLAERDKRIEAILIEADTLSKKQAAQELTIRTLRQTTRKAEEDAAEAVAAKVTCLCPPPPHISIASALHDHRTVACVYSCLMCDGNASGLVLPTVSLTACGDVVSICCC